MKKIITAAAICASMASTSAQAIGSHEVWQTIMDTTPTITGNWDRQCQGIAQSMIDIRTFRDAGYGKDRVFDMLYVFNNHDDDEFGLRVMIGLAFDRDLDFLSDQELARRIYRECAGAR